MSTLLREYCHTAEDGKKLKECFVMSIVKPNAAFVLWAGVPRILMAAFLSPVSSAVASPRLFIEWKVKGELYQVLVCFGCAEIKGFDRTSISTAFLSIR